MYVSAINIGQMNMNVYTQTYVKQHAYIHFISQIFVVYLLNINLDQGVMEVHRILLVPRERFKGR